MTQKRSRTSRYRSMSSIPHPPHSSISHLTQCPPIPLHRYHHVTTKLDVHLHLVPSSTGVVRRLRASPGNDSTRHAVMQLTAMHQNSCLSYTYEACSQYRIDRSCEILTSMKLIPVFQPVPLSWPYDSAPAHMTRYDWSMIRTYDSI